MASNDLRHAIVAANQWHATSFLTRLTYAGYIDGVYTSINNGTLRRHIPAAPVVEDVGDMAIVRLLREEFRGDPALYTEAADLHAKVDGPGRSPGCVKASSASSPLRRCFRELLGGRARELFLCSPRVTILLLTSPP